MGGDRYKNILLLLQEALEITMRIVNWIMILAPYGVAALLIKLVATQDVSMLSTLAQFVGGFRFLELHRERVAAAAEVLHLELLRLLCILDLLL